MAWKADIPLSTTKVKDYPALQRANNAAVEATLAASHTFPGVYGGSAGKHPNQMTFFDSLIFYDTGSNGQWQLYIDDDYIYIKGVQSGAWAQLAKFKRASAVPEIEFLLCSSWAYLPSNTKMLFGMASLPNNWSAPGTKLNDKFLRAVSGAGAGTGGAWTPTGFSCPSGGGVAHTHDWDAVNTGAASTTYPYAVAGTYPYYITPQGHVHEVAAGTTGSTDDSHAHSLTFGSSWRPAYVNVLEGVKD